jgi:hypothetical protein
MASGGSVLSTVEFTHAARQASDGDLFGYAVCALGDLDNDGIVDMAVSSPQPSASTGEIWIYFMKSNGDAHLGRRITSARLSSPLTIGDQFGSSLIYHGKVGTSLTSTKQVGIAVGAAGTSSSTGGIWLLTIRQYGDVYASVWISPDATPTAGDEQGSCLARIGDIDGDGNIDLAIGTSGRSTNQGTVQLQSVTLTATVPPASTLVSLTNPLIDNTNMPTITAGPIKFGASCAGVDVFFELETAMTRLYIGAPYDSGGGTQRGRVYLAVLDRYLKPSLTIQSLTSSSVDTSKPFGLEVTHTFIVTHLSTSLSGAYDITVKTQLDLANTDVTITNRPMSLSFPDIGESLYLPCSTTHNRISYYPSMPSSSSYALTIVSTWVPSVAIVKGTVLSSSMSVSYSTSPSSDSNSETIPTVALPLTVRYNYTTNLAPTLSCATTTAYEDTPLPLAIVLSDPDFGTLSDDGLITITIASMDGLLNVVDTVGIYYTPPADGLDDATMTFTAPFSNAVTTLSTITFTPSITSGTAVVTVDANDNGHDGIGGVQSATQLIVSLTVLEINDAPVVTCTTGTTVTGNEGDTFDLSSCTITDTDAALLTLSLTITTSGGVLSYAGPIAGVTAVLSPPLLIQLNGSSVDLTLALDLVTWTPPSSSNIITDGYATVTLSINDNGHTGVGLAMTDSYTITYQLSAVNNGPIVTSPATFTVFEDTSTAITGITATDPDVDQIYGGTLHITLSCSNGVLTLGTTVGVTFLTVGATGVKEASIEFRAASSVVTTALAGLVYLPSLNINGLLSDSISITVDDQGYYGSGGAASMTNVIDIDITPVNDAPSWLAPPISQTIDEDVATVITGLSVTDIDDVAAILTISGTAFSSGVLELPSSLPAGITVVTAGPALTVSFTGTITDVNTVLTTGITYTGATDYNGVTTSILFSVEDASSAIATLLVPIYIKAVNDAPTVIVPASPYVVLEDVATIISGISIADIDADDTWGALITVTLTITNGALSGMTKISGVACTGTTPMICKGSLTQLNLALAQLTFTSTLHYSGTTTLGITVNDNGNTGTGGSGTVSDSITIQVYGVDDNIVISMANVLTGVEDTPLTLPITLTDYDSLSNLVNVTATLTCGNGTFTVVTPGSTTVTPITSHQVSIAGIIGDLSTALASVEYLGASDYNHRCCGPDYVSLALSHTGPLSSTVMTSSKSAAVSLSSVNDPPTIIAVPKTVLQNGEVRLAGLTMWDVDVGEEWAALVNIEFTFPVASTSGATLRFDGAAGVSIVSSSTTDIIVKTSLPHIEAVCRQMWYVTASNWNGLDYVRVTISDNGYYGTGGTLSTFVDVPVTVTPVNQAPSLTSLPSSTTVDENTPVDFVLTITDIDDVTMVNMTGLITCDYCESITIPSLPTSYTFGSTSQTLTITWLAATPTLTVTLTPVSHWNSGLKGVDTMTTILADIHGASSSTVKSTLYYTPVNDAPTLTLPIGDTGFEDIPLYISGTIINDVDIDETWAAVMQVTINVVPGTGSVTLNSTAGLRFTTGDGYDDTSMIFFGGRTATQRALTTLRYLSGAAVVDTITIALDDLGNTGTGGAGMISSSFQVTISAVNDAPTLICPMTSISIVEDTTLSFIGAYAITANDVDAGAALLTVTITATHGSVNIPSIVDTIANINVQLATLVFTPTLDYNGVGASVTISIDDGGNTGAGGALTASCVIPMLITAVNDAPVVTFPAAITGALQDIRFYFTGANAITLTDDSNEAWNGLLTITISVTQGTLTFGGNRHGIHFTSAGLGISEATISCSATLSLLQVAISGMSYLSDGGWSGSETMSITVNDNGNTGTGGPLSTLPSPMTKVFTVGIVQAPLVIAQTGTMNVAEDTTDLLSLLTITDPNTIGPITASTITIVLTVPHGLLDAVGATLVGASLGPAASITLEGLWADVNTALTSRIHYQSLPLNYNGIVSLAIDCSYPRTDTSGGSATVTTPTFTGSITVTAVNDLPTLSVPAGPLSVPENTLLYITMPTGISVADVDVGDSLLGLLTVTLSVTSGIIGINSTAGLYVSSGTGSNDTSVTIVGGVTAINKALERVRYQANVDYNGGDTLSIAVEDNSFTGSGGTSTVSATITIAVTSVDQAPYFAASSPRQLFVMIEDDTLDLASVTTPVIIVDPENALLTVTITAANGDITLKSGVLAGGDFVVGNGVSDATMTFTALPATANLAISELVYHPDLDFTDYIDFDTVTITAFDGAGTGTYTLTVQVTAINDPPVVTLALTSATLNEGESISLSTYATVTDADVEDTFGGYLTMSVACTNGRLSFYKSKLVNQLTPTETPGSITSPNQDSYTYQLYQISGPPSTLNKALASMEYRAPNALTAVTVDNIVIFVRDHGSTGVGGEMTTSESIVVTITLVNDAPVWSVPSLQITTEDTPLDITGITLTDIDAAATDISVTLTALHGTLTFVGGPTFAGVTFDVGDGQADTTFTCHGTVSSLAVPLTILRYTPSTSYASLNQFEITLIATDIAAATSTSYIGVQVTAVNDAPIVTMPSGPLTTTSGGNLWVTGCSVSDVDLDESFAPLMEVTISVDSGLISVAPPSSTGAGLSFTTGNASPYSSRSPDRRSAQYPLLHMYGTLTAVNAALSSLAYHATSTCPATLTIVAKDNGQTGVGSPPLFDTSSVTINC